jgi:hypothetical protein
MCGKGNIVTAVVKLNDLKIPSLGCCILGTKEKNDRQCRGGDPLTVLKLWQSHLHLINLESVFSPFILEELVNVLP